MLKKFPSLTFVLLLGLPLSAFALEKELDAQTGIDKDAKASQDKIDELDDETSLNLQRYRLTAQRQ